MSTGARRGFTLIEVMIAVVILAVGLSSLFTSEAGAVKIAQRARSTTLATLLARCKMGEVEEKVSKEGWPGDLIEGRDECCEAASQEGFTCEWKVERIKLPEVDIEEGTGLSENTKKGAAGAAASAIGATGGTRGASERSAPAGGTLSGAGSGALASIDADAGIASMLTSSGSSGGGSDPLASFVMELTFPTMKPVIEEGVRRATVTVLWKEGSREMTFDVVQYLVNELPILPDESTTEAVTNAGETPALNTPNTPTPPPSQNPTPSSGGR